jgi:NAD(P)-dependent dehydrogenase (short-subunit alcohol dehydrogenase family)
MQLAGKTAIGNGAGPHIGKAIASRFAQEGSNVMRAELDADDKRVGQVRSKSGIQPNRCV